MGHAGTGGAVEELKIPYQIFGESLASASVLTLRGYRVSSQQVSLTASHPLHGPLSGVHFIHTSADKFASEGAGDG